MAFPLINYLKKISKVTLVLNDHNYTVISYLHEGMSVKPIDDRNGRAIIIIDLLSDIRSAEYIRNVNPEITIGFRDSEISYNHYLKQPSEFSSESAAKVYLQSISSLGLCEPDFHDFSCNKLWTYQNQEQIIISPFAGNINRCFPLESFLRLYYELIIRYSRVTFLLGPYDEYLSASLPQGINILISQNIQDTIQVMSESKIVIASEGGFMHIAASYGIPLVGLFKVASSKNWFPYKNTFQCAIGEGRNNYDDPGLFDLNLNDVINKTTEIYESIKC